VKRLGVDIGGTFTDIVLYDSSTQRIVRHKSLTTPDAPERAVLAGVRELLEQNDIAPKDVDEITYATTVATNAVLERKGPPTALVTTDGFRDVLLIQRQMRHDLFDLFIDKPRPMLSRHDIHTVRERLDAAGNTLAPLDEDGVRALAASFRANGVRSVAICFLHAYRDGRHEERTAELIHEVYPDCQLSLSSVVSPTIGEYERTNTTVIDAYVKPGTIEHLRRLEEGIVDLGIGAPLAVMLSDAGLASVERATSLPVRMIESGPAAGAQIAAFVGSAVNANRVIALDMGGTTAKVALIEDGRPALSDKLEVDRNQNVSGSGLPLAIPSVDLIEIGSGGGSIARVDEGIIRVGPESAGASPGPVAYGNGGTEPTVTDADLVLGYLNPTYFLGGRMQLDLDGAKAAISQRVAQPFGIGVQEAAQGIYEVINATMEQAIRAATVQRGRDPREYTMVATGGAAPMHAVAIARLFGIRKVVCPSASGVASAIGLLAAERRTSLRWSATAQIDEDFPEVAMREFAKLEATARAAFAGELVQTDRVIEFRRRVSLRYVGQGYGLLIDAHGGPSSYNAEETLEAFHSEYSQLYGRSDPSDAVEVTTWCLDAILETPELAFARRSRRGTSTEASNRQIYDPVVDSFTDATVWRLDDVPVDTAVPGPCVIEQPESTVVLFRGDEARVDPHGNVVVTVNIGGDET
jgi:N-methylhydantoinase A/oxoprolinase/acetone carboxylase beta subunit